MAEETTDKSSKTLEPSEKKLRDARKKGDTPSSRETGNLMIVVSLGLVTLFALPLQAPVMVELFTQLVEMSGRILVGESSSGFAQLGSVFSHFMLSLGIAIAPIFLMFFAAAIIGVLIRGETVVAVDRIAPKLSNISPLQGFKRLFSADAMVEFAKSLVKVLAVGTLALWVTHATVSQIWNSPGFLPETLPQYLSNAAVRLFFVVVIFLIPLAIFDVIWKRFDWMRKNRMSHKEVRDEYKEMEGAPELKAKRAQIRNKLARSTIAQSVPDATLILTNPTRLAIALKYRRGSDEAPICVAKGADHMARRIREIAFENDVPMIENIPLTRALYEVIDVDLAVPVEHWAILAEIIGYIFDMENSRKGRLPENSSVVLTP